MADVELEIFHKSKHFNTEKPSAAHISEIESHIKSQKGMRKKIRRIPRNSCASSDHLMEHREASYTNKTGREESSPNKVEEESGSNSRNQEVPEKPKGGRVHNSQIMIAAQSRSQTQKHTHG